MMISAAKAEEAILFLLAIILAFIIPFIMALIIWWTSKFVWAAIMLFVNVSTTLKRIEKKLEKYGTN